MDSDILQSHIVGGIIYDDTFNELLSQLIEDDTNGYPENASHATDPTIYSHATDVLPWGNAAYRSVSEAYGSMHTQVGHRSLDIIAEGDSTGPHNTNVNHDYQYSIQPHPPEPETTGHIQGTPAAAFTPSLNYPTVGVATLTTYSIQEETPQITQDIPGPPISTADNFDNTNIIPPDSGNPPNWMHVPSMLYPSEEAITHFVRSYKEEIGSGIREVFCSLCVWEGRSNPHNSKPSNLIRHLLMHFKIKTYKCRHCDKRFTTMDQAVVHSMSHHSATRQNAGGTFERLSSVGDN
ncbi:hypothetical protein RHS02_02547, partial [Rhizoctonia solani]